MINGLTRSKAGIEGANITIANIFHEVRPLLGAIASPKFFPQIFVIGNKKDLAICGRHAANRASHCRLFDNILHKPGNSLFRVVRPNFFAMNSIIGGEEKCAVELDYSSDIGIFAATINIGYQFRPGFGAITLPEFLARQSVVGGKEKSVAGLVANGKIITEI